MTVTIDQIKKLREMTGVSMTVCKKALEETNGDFDEAINVMRKKGEAKAADRAERSTSNGCVNILSNDSHSSMTLLLCETDFVARGDDFVDLLDHVNAKLFNGEITESDTELDIVKDAAIKLGEKLVIGGLKTYSDGIIGTYLHSNKSIGVLTKLEGGSVALAKDIAMHIAAMNPSVISPDEVSEESVLKEKEIWVEQLKNEGKPAEIIEKIMLGKEKKFREENALLKQAFVKNPEKTIEQLLSESSATIKEFTRFAV